MKIRLIILFATLQSFFTLAQEFGNRGVYAKNKSDYSDEFFECLYLLKGKSISLIDSLFITNSKDTVILPTYSEDTIEYKSEDEKWLLKFHPLNYSSIKYWISVIDSHLFFEGIANLNCDIYVNPQKYYEFGDAFPNRYYDLSINHLFIFNIGYFFSAFIVEGIGSPYLKRVMKQEFSGTEFYVKDRNNYSDEFLKDLGISKGRNKISLIDRLLIINSKDTVMLPTYSKDTIKYKSEDGSWSLKFQKVNYSSIKYWISTPDSDKYFEGFAHLLSMFYLCHKKVNYEISDYGIHENILDEYCEFKGGEMNRIFIGKNYCEVIIDRIKIPIFKKVI